MRIGTWSVARVEVSGSGKIVEGEDISLTRIKRYNQEIAITRGE
jgi:hypothetical protein